MGRSFYSPDLGRRQPLGEGLESWRGFYQSIRPTQMGLSLNIGIKLLVHLFWCGYLFGIFVICFPPFPAIIFYHSFRSWDVPDYTPSIVLIIDYFIVFGLHLFKFLVHAAAYTPSFFLTV